MHQYLLENKECYLRGELELSREQQLEIYQTFRQDDEKITGNFYEFKKKYFSKWNLIECEVCLKIDDDCGTVDGKNYCIKCEPKYYNGCNACGEYYTKFDYQKNMLFQYAFCEIFCFHRSMMRYDFELYNDTTCLNSDWYEHVMPNHLKGSDNSVMYNKKPIIEKYTIDFRKSDWFFKTKSSYNRAANLYKVDFSNDRIFTYYCSYNITMPQIRAAIIVAYYAMRHRKVPKPICRIILKMSI